MQNRSNPLRLKCFGWICLVGLSLSLSACGGGGGGGNNNNNQIISNTPPPGAFPAPHSQCTLSEAKSDVLELFEDFYFFNTEPAQQSKYATVRANLASYFSVDALLDDLRYQPGLFDRGFSFYRTQEEVDQFFSAGEFFGFGFSWGVDDSGDWRLIDVFTGSPADVQGLERGDTITAVDGTNTAFLNPNGEAVFGPPDAGVTRTLTVRSVAGAVRDVTLTKTTVGLDPVPQSRVQVFDVAGRKVGYVFLRTFIEDADDLLRAAFATLRTQNIDDLVLDLRYNSGGLVGTAEVLGSLMAGNARVGQLFFNYEYNPWVEDNFGDPDDFRFFFNEAEALVGLDHVYYLTGPASASASELMISGLAPYMSTSVVVGERTGGKPVGQWGLDYCNNSMVLFLVTFRTVNSLGEADYYNGIPADCAAADDWDHLLGDPAEGRLKAALDYVETTGAICDPTLSTATLSLSGGPVQERLPAPREGSLAARWLGAD